MAVFELASGDLVRPQPLRISPVPAKSREDSTARPMNFALKAWNFITNFLFHGAYMPPLVFFEVADFPLGVPEGFGAMEPLAGGMP